MLLKNNPDQASKIEMKTRGNTSSERLQIERIEYFTLLTLNAFAGSGGIPAPDICICSCIARVESAAIHKKKNTLLYNTYIICTSFSFASKLHSSTDCNCCFCLCTCKKNNDLSGAHEPCNAR